MSLARKTPIRPGGPIKRKAKPHLTKEGKVKPGFTKSGKAKVSTIKARIDKLMGFVVKHDCTCFAEGANGWKCSQRFETCHVIRRGEPAIFCDPLNLVPMCNVHHRFYTAHEDEWKAFVESKLPGRYDYLTRLKVEHKESGQKVDWAEWETYWRRKKREITG